MKEIIRQIKKHRDFLKKKEQWISIFNSIGINNDYNKLIQYCNNHKNYEVEYNKIDKTTLPEVILIFSKIIDLKKIHYVNLNDLNLKDNTLKLSTNDSYSTIPIHYITGELIKYFNNNINEGKEIYINLLMYNIEMDNSSITIKSKYYIK
jgi:hypothetical protein